MFKQSLFIPMLSLVLVSCGGGGSSDPTTTGATTTGTSESISLGNYRGQATIIVQEQSGYTTSQLAVTCTLGNPVAVNTYEIESNSFNLFCGSDNQAAATSFMIASAAIYTNQKTWEKMVLQYWTITSTNGGFEGKLTNKGYPVAVNLFSGKNFIYNQYAFNTEETKLSAIYYPSSNALTLKLKGQGGSILGGSSASFEADITLSKSY